MTDSNLLKFDFNERERARYTRLLRDIAKSANQSADALHKADDQGFFINFLMLAVKSKGMDEIGEIMKAHFEADRAAGDAASRVGDDLKRQAEADQAATPQH